MNPDPRRHVLCLEKPALQLPQPAPRQRLRCADAQRFTYSSAPPYAAARACLAWGAHLSPCAAPLAPVFRSSLFRTPALPCPVSTRTLCGAPALSLQPAYARTPWLPPPPRTLFGTWHKHGASVMQYHASASKRWGASRGRQARTGQGAGRQARTATPAGDAGTARGSTQPRNNACLNRSRIMGSLSA